MTAPGKARQLTELAVALALTGAIAAGCGGGGTPDAPGAARRTTSAPSPTGADAAAARLVKTGLGQLNQGDDRGAEVTFQNALSLDSGNLYAHYNLGLLAQRAGDAGTAMTEYDAALSTDASYAPALYNRGILTEPIDLPSAVSLYERAVRSDPDFAAAFMRLGFALVHLGKDQAGEKDLGRGVSLDPRMAHVQAPVYTR